MACQPEKPSGLTDNQSQAFDLAYEAARKYRENLPQEPARPPVDLDTAVSRFSSPLSEAGIAEQEVIETIVKDTDGALHKMSAPTFFGYVLGGSHPVGVAAFFGFGVGPERRLSV